MVAKSFLVTCILVALGGLVVLGGCREKIVRPVAAEGQGDTLDVYGRLHVAARDGDAEAFLDAAHLFVSDSRLFVDLVRNLEGGSCDAESLDVAVGALDLGVRLIAEGSTAICFEMQEERESFLRWP
jgi:hypothetical protein